jgi:hypothetical protein
VERGDCGCHHKDLAVLPLILSVLDPGLPIILFSSTQHRSVTQAVRDYPSIITDFAKPYLGGEDRDSADPQLVMADLSWATLQAFVMIEIRKVWLEAVNKWKLPFKPLKWSNHWPVFQLPSASCPVNWLRNEWLPLAQRGHYALAAALPWRFLRSMLGETRLAILLREKREISSETEDKVFDCLSLIQSAHNQYSLPPKDPKKAIRFRSTEREIAVVAALALIELLAEWSNNSGHVT